MICKAWCFSPSCILLKIYHDFKKFQSLLTYYCRCSYFTVKRSESFWTSHAWSERRDLHCLMYVATKLTPTKSNLSLGRWLWYNHPGPELYVSRKKFSHWFFNWKHFPTYQSMNCDQNWKAMMLSWRENSQNSHQKSPKSPFGGILPFCVNETCRESNSVWKIGITSFIRITQSKISAFQKSQKSLKMADFQSIELWC